MLSGQEDRGLIISAIKAGAQDYLSKMDVSSSSLDRAISNAIDRQATMIERDVLLRIAQIVSSTLTVGEVLDSFAIEVGRLIPINRLVIAKVKPEDGEMFDQFIWGDKVPGWDGVEDRPRSNSGSRRSLEIGRGMIVDIDNLAPPDQFRGFELAAAAGLHSAMFAPLISNDEVFGTLNVKSRRKDAYGPEHLEALERVASQIAGALRAADLYEQAVMWSQEKEHRMLLEAEKWELERVNQSKSEFMSTVSHELKTPLTSITAFLDILSRNRPGNLLPKQIEQLAVMRRNGQRLDMLINDLLDLSRIESGQFSLRFDPFDANEMVSELAVSFEPLTQAKSQRLEIDMADNPIWVKGDQARISQVVGNLISNASKYSDEGTTISLALTQPGDHLRIEVKDSGYGIAEKDIPNLFTLFFRVDDATTRSVPGTGLGLAIAKTIITMHEGEINVTSELGVGTSVSIEIPGVMDQAEAEAELAATYRPMIPHSRLETLDNVNPRAA